MQCVLSALPVLAELNDERELSTLTRLACGGIAGTTGQTVAYPLDVVRRRMQVQVRISIAAFHDFRCVGIPGMQGVPGQGLILAGAVSADNRYICCIFGV